MAFTDDDLKRLKEWVEYPCFLSTDIPEIRKLLPGFISRLEAAERCLLDGGKDEAEKDKDFEAWRKASGKGA